MSSARRVRKRISPIQMKSGSAVSVQLDDESQIVTFCQRVVRPAAS